MTAINACDAIMDRYRSLPWFRLEDQQEVKRACGYTYIICPLHGESCGHLAYYPSSGDWGRILNFPCTHRYEGEIPVWDQGWIDVRMGQVIARILNEEEAKFQAKIKEFEHVPLHSMTPEKAVVLWHSKGCPEEIAAEVSTNSREFYKLVEEHKATGKKGDKKKSVYQA